MFYKWTNHLIAERERHGHVKITNISTRNNLTHLKIISSFTMKVSKATNKGKYTKNEQVGLLLGEEDPSTSKRQTLLFALTWHTWKSYHHIEVSIACNKRKCTKNEQMILLLPKEDTPTIKQLMLTFVLTKHIMNIMLSNFLPSKSQ